MAYNFAVAQVTTRNDQLQRGRKRYGERRWEDAYLALVHADDDEPLALDDLETLSWCAVLTGRDERFFAISERLYNAHRDAGRDQAAARAAFWIAFRLVTLGEMGRASGWMSRAQRLVDGADEDCAVRGWLKLPVAHRHLAMGDNDAAHDVAAEAAAIGDRFGDADLTAFARNLQGRALMRRGDVEAGLALVDEAMVSASSGELSPFIMGLVYCTVIATCHQVFAFDRAREWTSVLAQWCDEQPELLTFTRTCLVHRAEIMELGGAWRESLAEVRRATARFAREADPQALGAAHYQAAEIHRLRGELSEAEEAYCEAHRHGREPQPGLALLRLAQGRTEAAAAALHRVLAATSAPLSRARFLPAQVEVMLAAGDLDGADTAASELSAIAERFGTDVLDALAAHARGAVSLAGGDARSASNLLRRAFEVWQRLGAPYRAAQIRVALGHSFGALGDKEGKQLELEAARRVFEDLGAMPELRRMDAIDQAPPATCGLSPRELEVLRHVAEGMTNKAIGVALHVSERTVDRHVSNIFVKLEVSSRAAATAFAYEHGLV